MLTIGYWGVPGVEIWIILYIAKMHTKRHHSNDPRSWDSVIYWLWLDSLELSKLDKYSVHFWFVSSQFCGEILTDHVDSIYFIQITMIFIHLSKKWLFPKWFKNIEWNYFWKCQQVGPLPKKTDLLTNGFECWLNWVQCFIKNTKKKS